MPARSAIVRVGLGLLLLATAGLKLYGLGVSSVPRVGWFSQPWVQLLAAEWELVLGGWLLSGARPRLSWLAALATFVSFAGVSGYLGWVGVASCGCLGAIKANPWWAFGVDVAAVALLAWARPEWASLREYPRLAFRIAGRRAFLLFCGSMLLLSLLAGVGMQRYGSLDAMVAHLRGERVSIRPDLVDVGRGVPGQSIEASVALVNRTKSPVRIIGGTSDCSCVATDNLPVTLQPGESRSVSLRVDLPRATGRFTRKVWFWTDDAQARTIVFPVTGTIELPASDSPD